MKTIIATTAIALSLSAPAFAQVDDVRAHFAAGNDSPLESRVVGTSIGDTAAARDHVISGEESPLAQGIAKAPVTATRNAALIEFFAQPNNSNRITTVD